MRHILTLMILFTFTSANATRIVIESRSHGISSTTTHNIDNASLSKSGVELGDPGYAICLIEKDFLQNTNIDGLTLINQINAGTFNYIIVCEENDRSSNNIRDMILSSIARAVRILPNVD